GMVPAITTNLGRCFRQFVIPARHQRAARDNFAALVTGKQISFIMHNAEAHSGSWFTATCQSFGMLAPSRRCQRLLVKECQEHGCFGLTIGLTQARSEEFDSTFKF